jgi:hypothetical protein
MSKQEMPGEYYQPSGRVYWPAFAPMVLLAFAAAWGVGRTGLLYAPPGGLVVHGVLPTLILVVAVLAGKCRNPAIATACAVGVGLTLLGTGLVRGMELYGSDSLTGAFATWCAFVAFGSTNGWLMTLGYLVRAVELSIYFLILVKWTRHLASRVYYEEQGQRWASSCTIPTTHRDLEKVLAAIRDYDWSVLSKLAVIRDDRDLVRFEYHPGSGLTPVYVSVYQSVFGSLPWLTATLPFLRWIRVCVLRRRMIVAELAQGLGAVAPMIPAGVMETPVAAGADGVLAYSSEVKTAQSGRMSAAAVVEEMGLGGHDLTMGQNDFRAAAAGASQARGAATFQSLAQAQSICTPRCSPVAYRTLRAVAWLNLAVSLLLFLPLLAILLFPLAMVLGQQGMYVAARSLGMTAGLCMMAAFPAVAFQLLVYPWLRKGLLLLVVRNQRGCLLPVAWRGLKVVSIEDAATHHVRKVVPEDLGVLWVGKGQVIVEGIAFRYVINAADVRTIRPTPAEISVVVRYAAAGVPLEIVIHPQSNWVLYVVALSKYPIVGLPFLAIVRLAKHAFVSRMTKALAATPEATPPPLAQTPQA